MIARAKARLWTPPRLLAAARDLFQRSLAQAWVRYEILLAESDAGLRRPARRPRAAAAEHDDVLGACGSRWTAFAVDEYQDTNPRRRAGSSCRSARGRC